LPDLDVPNERELETMITRAHAQLLTVERLVQAVRELKAQIAGEPAPPPPPDPDVWDTGEEGDGP
jgi:hypothetical protein